MRRIFMPKLRPDRAILLRVLAGMAAVILLLVCVFWRDTGAEQKQQPALCYPVEVKGEVVQVEAAGFLASCGILASGQWAAENEAFRKAVCVVINSNAWYLMQRMEAIPKDGCGMTWEEETAVRKAYGDALWESWYDTAAEVQTQLLCYKGEPVLAAYHRCGFGITESAETLWGVDLPYLTWVRSGDMAETESRREFFFTEEQFSEKWGADAEISGFRIASRSAAGNVLTVRCGKEELTGAEFAKRFSLPSMAFTAQKTENGIRIVCIGEGSGVGLSLCGAKNLSRNGVEYTGILQQYYPGTRLISLGSE